MQHALLPLGKDRAVQKDSNTALLPWRCGCTAAPHLILMSMARSGRSILWYSVSASSKRLKYTATSARCFDFSASF